MEWSVDLPDWQSYPDPEITGQSLWVHTNYDGEPDVALVLLEEGRTEVSVLSPVMITPAEVDGECRASLPSWDAALEFALTVLENQR